MGRFSTSNFQQWALFEQAVSFTSWAKTAIEFYISFVPEIEVNIWRTVCAGILNNVIFNQPGLKAFLIHSYLTAIFKR